jgi:hypothetical protein
MAEFKKRQRPVEQTVGREVEKQAGKLLCTFAGLRARADTARYLADVVKEGRWAELSVETARRLRAVPIEILEGLARDVLD